MNKNWFELEMPTYLEKSTNKHSLVLDWMFNWRFWNNFLLPKCWAYMVQLWGDGPSNHQWINYIRHSWNYYFIKTNEFFFITKNSIGDVFYFNDWYGGIHEHNWFNFDRRCYANLVGGSNNANGWFLHTTTL